MHFEADEKANKTSVEYFFINLPECLSKEGPNFIKTLVSTGNHDYFESLPIQTIIEFKWDKYTRDFFVKQFYIFLIFFFANIVDIYYSILIKEVNDNSEIVSDDRIIYVCIGLKTICVAILLYFCHHEIK